MANNDVLSALSKKTEKNAISSVGGLAEMFGLTENIQISMLPISQLMEKGNHPFKVLDDEKLHSLAESIIANGLVQPIIVRPLGEKTYEILSGHRRTRACQINGFIEIKAIIVDADDELANRIMIVTNFQQRDVQLPSEIAKSYLIRYNDLKSRKKSKTDNSTGWNSEEKIDKIMEKEFMTSKSKIYMYLRLNHLLPEFLDLLDSKKLNIKVATELSYLSDDEQRIVYEQVYIIGEYKLDLKKAIELKKQSNESPISRESVKEILCTTEKSDNKVLLSKLEVKKYQDKFSGFAEMKKAIVKFLEEY